MLRILTVFFDLEIFVVLNALKEIQTTFNVDICLFHVKIHKSGYTTLFIVGEVSKKLTLTLSHDHEHVATADTNSFP